MSKKGLIERLSEGIVIGDGGFASNLEKRGYVKADPWTPEVVVEHPEAVRQLHREFLRAGSNVMQAFTFYATEQKLNVHSNEITEKYNVSSINSAAYELAKEVADEGDALVSVSLSPIYIMDRNEEKIKSELRKQCKLFSKYKIDFIMIEHFQYIKEAEWAIQIASELNVPIVTSMCINTEGDMDGVSIGDCAVRMVNAGAKVIGINCHFDPFIVLEGIKQMKKAIDDAGYKEIQYISQPLGYHTPDANKFGHCDLPEFPFAIEPRTCTRWDIHKYARKAYNVGIRYIGGCCGFEPYHIRAISEELSAECGGRLPKGSEKHGHWGTALSFSMKISSMKKITRNYWENLKPASGRPYCPSLSKPDLRDSFPAKDQSS